MIYLDGITHSVFVEKRLRKDLGANNSQISFCKTWYLLLHGRRN